MRIERVILALNNNQTYAGFWNAFSKVWKTKFKITPTLMFVGTEEEMRKEKLSEEYGQIVRLDPSNDVILDSSLDWSVTWALFYGATLFPDEVCMTSGIDQLPLSEKFMTSIGDHSKESYIVGFAGAYKDIPNVFPSSHHVATGKTFKKIYDIEDEWHSEIVKVFNSRSRFGRLSGNYWGLDEAYSSECLLASDHDKIIYKDTFYSDWVPYRLDRGGALKYDIEKLKNGFYTELHSPRPYEEHKRYLDTLIKNMLDE
jgi:hypothetical protein